MDLYSYQTFRVVYEVASAIFCFILARFMIKPYQVTGESRYLGLPLGFGFLGATYALSAFVYAQPTFIGSRTMYFQLVVRTFAFIFLCITYYFSNNKGDRKRLWNITLTLLIITSLFLFLIVFIPNVALPSYQLTSIFTRFFNIACIAYLCAHTLRSHLKKPDPETLWTPLGYFLLGISQYSLIIYSIDNSMSAWWGALAIRWAGLFLFLFVSYKSFYSIKKRGIK
jgi:hypothetical protein